MSISSGIRRAGAAAPALHLPGVPGKRHLAGAAVVSLVVATVATLGVARHRGDDGLSTRPVSPAGRAGTAGGSPGHAAHPADRPRAADPVHLHPAGSAQYRPRADPRQHGVLDAGPGLAAPCGLPRRSTEPGLAARIDGSSRLGVVFRIVIPAAAPAIAAATAIVFIGIWNDFMFIATIGGRDTHTLASFLGGRQRLVPHAVDEARADDRAVPPDGRDASAAHPATRLKASSPRRATPRGGIR